MVVSWQTTIQIENPTKSIEKALSRYFGTRITVNSNNNTIYSYYRTGPFQKRAIKSHIIEIEPGLYEVFDNDVTNERIIISLTKLKPNEFASKIFSDPTLLKKVKRNEYAAIKNNQVFGRLKIKAKNLFVFLPKASVYISS